MSTTASNERPQKRQLKRVRTQVGIIGAGPAGLVLALLLQQAGIDCQIVERQTRHYVEARARAGVIEHRVVQFLRQHGFSVGMDQHGIVHTSCEFRLAGKSYLVSYGKLVNGAHMVYPQQFLVADLIQLYLDRGGIIRFSHPATAINDLNERQATILCQNEKDPSQLQLICDYVAGCDGFHGIARQAIPNTHIQTFSHQYDIGWLALLAKMPADPTKLVYALHPDGFAGQMPRTSEVARFYLECSHNDYEEAWPFDRIWNELRRRLGESFDDYPIIERKILNMRSVVTEPMQYGRLFLAGDAAHIITPVGAKGMNLAIGDAEDLAKALIQYYQRGDTERLETYSRTRLPHIWRKHAFSDWMVRLIHSSLEPNRHSPFFQRLRQTRIEQLCDDNELSRWFATQYVGLE